MRNLKDSFREYVAKDQISDYRTEHFGLQDAEKGAIFQSFPPFLILHLMRSEHDDQLNRVVEYTDRYEYPEEIDLDEFLDSVADRRSSWVYRLRSVMVCLGDLNEGRYTALITPDNGSSWLKFDDDKVTPAHKKEVFEDNFGGTLQPSQGQNEASRASVLVYVRESADDILESLLEETTPPPLSASFNFKCYSVMAHLKHIRKNNRWRTRLRRGEKEAKGAERKEDAFVHQGTLHLEHYSIFPYSCI